jgi:hypothetical protein
MSALTRFLAGVLAGIAVLGVSACGSDDPSGPQTGSLEVLLTMDGPDQDSNGGTLYLNDEAMGAIVTNVRKTLTELETGIHVIRIAGINPNCQSQVPNERNVTIRAGQVAEASYRFLCESTGGKDPGGDPID